MYLRERERHALTYKDGLDLFVNSSKHFVQELYHVLCYMRLFIALGFSDNHYDFYWF